MILELKVKQIRAQYASYSINKLINCKIKIIPIKTEK